MLRITRFLVCGAARQEGIHSSYYSLLLLCVSSLVGQVPVMFTMGLPSVL